MSRNKLKVPKLKTDIILCIDLSDPYNIERHLRPKSRNYSDCEWLNKELQANPPKKDMHLRAKMQFGKRISSFQFSQAECPSPNPANVSLFQAHPEQVNALMQAMGNPPH